MTDIEIDKALALAIGYKPEQMRFHLDDEEFSLFVLPSDTEYWLRRFSHLDWNVISPIAERYNMFPYKLRGIECHAGWNVLSSGCDFTDAVPQRAIAMAVIQGAKK